MFFSQLQFEVSANKKEYEALKALNSELYNQIREKLKSASTKSTEKANTLPEPTEPQKEESRQQQLSNPTSNVSNVVDGDDIDSTEDSENPPKCLLFGQCIQIAQTEEVKLKNMPTSADNDSNFVNTLFDVLFPQDVFETLFADENNEKKKIKIKMPTTTQYGTMKGKQTMTFIKTK